MPHNRPSPDAARSSLFDDRLDRYWAVWQHPERRYAYSVDSEHESWLILLGSKATGEACLASDARQNGRPLDDYRLDELTLPDAFEAVRTQPTPYLSTYGRPIARVCGVVVVAHEPHGWATIRRIPL